LQLGIVLAVAAGGAFGSVARYEVTQWVVGWTGPSAWGTFTVNITGAFILGIIAGATEMRLHVNPVLRTGLTVGVMGGYTTFSTFMYESTRQMETRAFWQAGANLGGSVLIGLLAMMLGLAIGRATR
jgi:CrcB protein